MILAQRQRLQEQLDTPTICGASQKIHREREGGGLEDSQKKVRGRVQACPISEEEARPFLRKHLRFVRPSEEGSLVLSACLRRPEKVDASVNVLLP